MTSYATRSWPVTVMDAIELLGVGRHTPLSSYHYQRRLLNSTSVPPPPIVVMKDGSVHCAGAVFRGGRADVVALLAGRVGVAVNIEEVVAVMFEANMAVNYAANELAYIADVLSNAGYVVAQVSGSWWRLDRKW